MPFNQYLADIALVRTQIALEGFLPVSFFEHPKPSEPGGEPRRFQHLAPRDEAAPDGPHHLIVRGHGDRLPGEPLKGRKHRRIEGHPALKQDMIAHGPFFHDPVQIVGGDAVGRGPRRCR